MDHIRGMEVTHAKGNVQRGLDNCDIINQDSSSPTACYLSPPATTMEMLPESTLVQDLSQCTACTQNEM